MIGINQISIPKDADSEAFEEFMKTEVFPKVAVGQQTRGGIVTAQYLLKSESPRSEHNYSWIVRRRIREDRLSEVQMLRPNLPATGRIWGQNLIRQVQPGS